eukprot:c11922_g1_i1 orf=557-865(+)
MMLVLKEALPFSETRLPLHPSIEYLTCILLRCRKEQNFFFTSNVHAYMRKWGLDSHGFLGNYLVLIFVEFGSIHNAQQVFDRLDCRDELSWNSLITGFIKWG